MAFTSVDFLDGLGWYYVDKAVAQLKGPEKLKKRYDTPLYGIDTKRPMRS